MNVKQLLLAVVILIVLGATSVMLLDNEWTGEGSGVGDKVIKNVPVNDITKITVKGKDKLATLEKTNGVWSVLEEDGYPADFQKISSAVLKLRDLKVSKVVKAKPDAYGRLHLDAADKTSPPVVVSCFDKTGGKVAEMKLGKEHQRKGAQQMPYGSMADGRYVLAKDASKPVLVSETLNEFSTDSFSWVDRSFVSITKVKSIEMKEGDKTLWTLDRKDENGKFELASVPAGREADADAVSSVSSAFNYVYFEDVKKAVEEKQQKSVLITTFEGFTYTVDFHKVAVDYFVNISVDGKFQETREAVKDEKPEDAAKRDQEFNDNLKTLKEKLATEKKYSGWFYKFSASKVESMLKSLEELTKEKEAKKEEKTDADSKAPAPIGPVKTQG